jgi:hypothetical protein
MGFWSMSRALVHVLFAAAAAFLVALFPGLAWSQKNSIAPSLRLDQQLVREFCIDCHDGTDKATTFRLDQLATAGIDQNADAWEKVVRKLELREMPPAGAPRPTEDQYSESINSLTKTLDAIAADKPRPGRTETFRRLTRFEYQNAIRDLLNVEVDVSDLLPSDESSRGFDNITVADLSPTLLTRYIAAAQKISRLAVARATHEPAARTYRMRPDVTQDTHVEGLPLGTRGGLSISHFFPVDGDYSIEIRLMRDRNSNVEALKSSETLEVLFDRDRLIQFDLEPPPKGENDSSVDANLKTRFRATAGRHDVGVTFVAKSSALLESPRQPLNVHFNFYRHPRLGPAVYEVSIIGPIVSSDSVAAAAVERPSAETVATDTAKAREKLSSIVRRAIRRPITSEDLQGPLEFFRKGRDEGGFDAGLEAAVTSVLVSPQFLFRIEREPPGAAPSTPYRISDFELASRLSFFLWSSLPDDELLTLAEDGKLSNPDTLKTQTLRMLADARSRALVTNFADQWLYLRNLDSATPDMRLYPDFDDNLRQAFREETELLFESVMREDRSVVDLIRSEETFLNERLARHYGIPHVHGSHFRRVKIEPGTHRGGLLRHGSVLTVSSYATRTSPVLRGKWVLENILSSPPPPPPENVPALTDNTVSSTLSVRERLAQHRAHQACAVCHDRIDPIGLALENFDAIGRWRDYEEGHPVDVTGGLFTDQKVNGVDGLEKALLERPELFARALTEKLMTYALGRGVELSDSAPIRAIVRDASRDNYRFSSLILGIVNSTPFKMRLSAP